MPDNKRISIEGDNPVWITILVLVFLFIITFWGEPDLLDLILIRLGG